MATKKKAPTKAEQHLEKVRAICHAIYSGAQGVIWAAEEDFATAKILSKVIPVLRDFSPDAPEWMFSSHCLEHFDNPDSAAKHLADDFVLPKGI